MPVDDSSVRRRELGNELRRIRERHQEVDSYQHLVGLLDETALDGMSSTALIASLASEYDRPEEDQ